MKQSDYVHLHVHTTRSLLDGYTKVPDLVDVIKAHGQIAVACTEHGSLGSIPELWREAKRVGIKPIAGLEAYLCEDRLSRTKSEDRKVPYFHLTILAQNVKGYENLCKLSNISYFEGFYSKPRIDLAAFEAHSEGLIVLSGCVGGWPQQLIIKGEEQEALEWCMMMEGILGERFLLESQETGEKVQKKVNETFLRWTKQHGFRHVVTGDSHYTSKKDSADHDALLCIGLGKKLSDEARIKFVPEQYYIKNAAEMAKLGFPESSLKNTRFVADMVESYDLPRAGGFPKVEHAYEILESSAMEGLAARVPDSGDSYWERLTQELGVIQRLGFEDYFLIAHDITRYARETGMYWTWGRGSSVGSLVAYALGITNIDPVEHSLYFERFLNESRRNPPDIDIDFTDEDRPLIIDYIERKYGADHVAHIATFGSLGPRQVLIDLVRVLGKNEHALKSVIETLPYDPTMKIDDLFEDHPKVIACIRNLLGADTVEYMKKFSGIPRHASVHAAGVIIDRESLVGKIPMLMPRGRPVKASQYVYEDLVTLGFEKFDILGVRTLRTIKDTARLVGLDLDKIPLDDKKTYDMISRGNTIGVFQLEGWGYRQFVNQFKPRNFEDIMMTNALYRPGPMKGGKGLGVIIARRTGQQPVTYIHPKLEPILKPTFGVMVYQEQVMAVVREMAGWTLAEADQLRYAVGKKKLDLVEELKIKFIEDCTNLGHTTDFAAALFEEIEFFGRYGWNKAHAAAYGMVTYVTAYLKANHPHEFLCCMINANEADPKHVQALVGECSRIGIKVSRPHVNDSIAKFQVMSEADGTKRLLAGLASVKFLGDKGVAEIVSQRRLNNRFSSIENFRARIPPKLCNSVAIKNLRAVRAFDGLPETEALVELPF